MAELASDVRPVDLVSDSSVNLSEGEVVEVAGDDQEPASAEGVIARVEEEMPVEELTEIAALDAVSPDHDSSAVDLGRPPRLSDESLSAEEVEEVAEVPDGSGIDLEGLPVPAASTSDLHPSSESSVDLGSHGEIPAASVSEVEESLEPVSESGIDLDSLGEPPAGVAASDLALESLLSESASSEAVVEEEPVAAEEALEAAEEPVAAEAGGLFGQETVSEESALAAVDEPVVSEEEVNDLLAGLEETPGEPSEEAAEGEGAIAAAEAEEEAVAEEDAGETAAEDEDEKKPAKPVKQRSRVPALVGGTFLGMLIGAGGLIGARFGGVDVPAMIGAGEKEKAPAVKKAPAAAPVTFQALQAMVLNGDWEGANKAGIETAPANKAEELAAHGDYRLGQYLKNAGNKINPQDPALQPAIQDLQKAAEQKDPTALYDLAWIKELAGQLPEARAEYAKGAQQFQDKPVLKEQFEAAIQRVDWKASLKREGAARLLLPQRMEDRAALLALLLIGFQQPPQPAPQPGGPPAGQKEDNKEAGFEFWQAAKLAHEGKYGDAIRAIDRAARYTINAVLPGCGKRRIRSAIPPKTFSCAAATS